MAKKKKPVEVHLSTAAQSKELEGFIGTLRDETPRGAILISAQFADIMLQRVLTAASRPQVAKSLLDGPLAHFYGRILAAYGFGLLPDDMFWNLEQLRAVRNHCAHSMETISFADETVKAHIDTMRVWPDLPIKPASPANKLAVVLMGLAMWSRATIRELHSQGGLGLRGGK